MRHELHQAPSDCPVCGRALIVTGKGCRNCGTELVGEFAPCEFCAFDADDQAFIRAFLLARGDLSAVGGDDPGSRLDAIRGILDLSESESDPSSDAGPQHAAADAPELHSQDHQGAPDHNVAQDHQGAGSASTSAHPTARQQILARVASGEISASVAARLLETIEN